MAAAKTARKRAVKKTAAKTNGQAKASEKRSLEDLSIEELRNLAKVLAHERDVARRAFARVVEAAGKATAAANDADYLMRRAVDDYNAALQPKQSLQA